MFVPSEGVYYELLMTQDAKYGPLDEYCRTKRVFPVSPNTFYACLSAVAMSLQGQKIEENARHLLAGMSGLKKHLESFADVYEKLGTHLRNAQQSYEEADSRLNRTRNSLEQMSQGALPEASTLNAHPCLGSITIRNLAFLISTVASTSFSNISSARKSIAVQREPLRAAS